MLNQNNQNNPRQNEQPVFINGKGDRLKFERFDGGDSVWAVLGPNSNDVKTHLNFSRYMQYGADPSIMDIAQPEGGLIPFDPDNPIIGSILRVEYEGKQSNAVLVFDNHLIPTFSRGDDLNRFIAGPIYCNFLDIDYVFELTKEHKILGIIAYPANTANTADTKA